MNRFKVLSTGITDIIPMTNSIRRIMELKDLETRRDEITGFIKLNDERSLKLQEMAKQVNEEYAQIRNYNIANYATLTEINKWIEAIKKKEVIADINKDYIPNDNVVDIKSKKKK